MSLSNFDLLSKLGEGSFSTVFKVRRRSDSKLYALKKAKFDSLKPKDKENCLNEVRILASIKHPNIIEYKEAFFSSDGKELCIVMEYAELGDLYERIKQHKANGSNFLEIEVWEALVQITSALKALHDLKILHRDLKCANVFLGTDNQFKLGDLNVSKINKAGLVYTQTGTPYYASPEVWRDKPYNASSDIWSLGVVLYEMAALIPPFTANCMKGLYAKVTKGTFPRIPECYSDDLFRVIQLMLQINPKQRPSCNQILRMAKNYKSLEVGKNTNNELLGTIKMSFNINALTRRLPAARYERKEIAKSGRNIASSSHLSIRHPPDRISLDSSKPTVKYPAIENLEHKRRIYRVASLMLEKKPITPLQVPILPSPISKLENKRQKDILPPVYQAKYLR